MCHRCSRSLEACPVPLSLVYVQLSHPGRSIAHLPLIIPTPGNPTLAQTAQLGNTS